MRLSQFIMQDETFPISRAGWDFSVFLCYMRLFVRSMKQKQKQKNTLLRLLHYVLAVKKLYWPRIDLFFSKYQNMDPKHKIPVSLFKILSDQFWVNIIYVWVVFWAKSLQKNLFLCSWEITKKSFRRKWLKNFHFSTLWIWLFGIFDKRPQGCDEGKNSMGLLQGPRRMAWTTKSPIWGNHWVPLGCRAILGSVKHKIIDIPLKYWKYGKKYCSNKNSGVWTHCGKSDKSACFQTSEKWTGSLMGISNI